MEVVMWLGLAAGCFFYVLFGAGFIAGTHARVDTARLRSITVEDAQTRLAALKIVGALLWIPLVIICMVIVTGRGLGKFSRWLDQPNEGES